jgi:VanZ family protein
MTDTPPRLPLAAILWKLLLAGYVLALVVSTHLPPSFPLLPPEGTDKLAHFGAYAALAWLLAMAWESSTGRLNGRHLRFAWLAIVLFAMGDEITQPWFGRDADVFDWLTDAVGAATGLAMFVFTRRWFQFFWS